MQSHNAPNFSRQTVDFLRRAGRARSRGWLDARADEYERLLRAPLVHLATTLSTELRSLAPDYHFPTRGVGRLARSAARAQASGPIKGWVSLTLSRPRKLRFEQPPSIFFMINPEDTDGDQVLLAGGLYMPSSRQLRQIRESIAADASPVRAVFADRAFRARFGTTFSDERQSSRVPRGFSADHAEIDWIRLQGFFVWRSYPMREFASAGFAERVSADARELLKLNRVLEAWTDERVSGNERKARLGAPLGERDREHAMRARIAEVEAPRRPMDF